jgi:hypothetical protein
MFLGLVVAGAGLGAAAGVAWFMSGGSILVAIALYSAVATAFVLGAAMTAFLVSARRESDVSPEETLHPAE